MLENIDRKSRRYLEKGELGESFVRWWCQESNITYKKATFYENRDYGIDAYIEGTATDIKNTRGVYFGRVYKDSNSFYVRHPFRKNTKCSDYLIVEIENNKSFNIKYQGPIQEYLVNNYFNSEDDYQTFLTILNSLDKTSISANGYTYESFLFELKKEVLQLTKPNILCHYNSTFTSDKEVSIKLISKEDKMKENNFIKEKREN